MNLGMFPLPTRWISSSSDTSFYLSSNWWEVPICMVYPENKREQFVSKYPFDLCHCWHHPKWLIFPQSDILWLMEHLVHWKQDILHFMSAWGIKYKSAYSTLCFMNRCVEQSFKLTHHLLWIRLESNGA